MLVKSPIAPFQIADIVFAVKSAQIIGREQLDAGNSLWRGLCYRGGLLLRSAVLRAVWMLPSRTVLRASLSVSRAARMLRMRSASLLQPRFSRILSVGVLRQRMLSPLS